MVWCNSRAVVLSTGVGEQCGREGAEGVTSLRHAVYADLHGTLAEAVEQVCATKWRGLAGRDIYYRTRIMRVWREPGT